MSVVGRQTRMWKHQRFTQMTIPAQGAAALVLVFHPLAGCSETVGVCRFEAIFACLIIELALTLLNQEVARNSIIFLLKRRYALEARLHFQCCEEAIVLQ